MGIGNNIKRLRKINRLSQEKLAEIIDVSRQAVAKWESGKCYPDINKLIILSNIFNVTLDELVSNNLDDNCEPKGKINLRGGITMEDQDSIIEFLCRAKKDTYASGNKNEVLSCRPNSHDLEYVEGSLKYIDSYFGGEKFAGEECLFKNNKPLWAMNYVGRVLDEGFSGGFLKEVLSNVTKEYPYRGPLEYKNDEYYYKCTIEGEFIWFKGYESIYIGKTKVFECNFHGGLIQER